MVPFPNVPKILEKLKNFKLSFVRTPAENWIECSKIKQHQRSSEQLKEALHSVVCVSIHAIGWGYIDVHL